MVDNPNPEEESIIILPTLLTSSTVPKSSVLNENFDKVFSRTRQIINKQSDKQSTDIKPKNKSIIDKAVEASKKGTFYSHSRGETKLGNNNYKGLCTSGPETFYRAAGIELKGLWWNTGSPKTATGTKITNAGFKKVWNGSADAVKNGEFEPKEGDILLSYGKHKDGSPTAHAQMWNGERWVSDTNQSSAWVYNKGGGRRGNDSAELYRLAKKGMKFQDGGELFVTYQRYKSPDKTISMPKPIKYSDLTLEPVKQFKENHEKIFGKNRLIQQTSTENTPYKPSPKDNNGNAIEISDAMFNIINTRIEDPKQSLTAKVMRHLGETWATGPYGQVYKWIDENGNLLKQGIPFKEGETVTRQFALANAKAYANKKAAEWKKKLEGLPGLTQDRLDALTSMSYGGKSTQPNSEFGNFVKNNWGNWEKIAKKWRTHAINGKSGPLRGLRVRRAFEADWFLGKKGKDYREYQNTIK